MQETTILRHWFIKFIKRGNRCLSLHGRCADRLLRFTLFRYTFSIGFCVAVVAQQHSTEMTIVKFSEIQLNCPMRYLNTFP